MKEKEMTVKEFLKKSQVFRNLSDKELERVAEISREEVYMRGAIIFSEGDKAQSFYVVKEGKVALEMSLSLRPDLKRKGTIDILTEGQILGWSAIVGPQVFTMTARCIQDTTVIAMDSEKLYSILTSNFCFGYKVMEGVAEIISLRFQRAKETIAQILSIASHDLKAPLSAVQSYLQVILEGFVGEINEKQRFMLQRSKERISEFLNLISNILDLSGIETIELDMKPIALSQVVRELAENLCPLAKGKGIGLKVQLPTTLPQVKGSPERLKQVISNLLDNAIKFTSAPGEVLIRLTEENEHIRIEVMDTGIGIPSDELPHVFDDFYRGKAANAGGIGLGLSLAKRIVEAHKGRIWVESPCPETGKGSKFTFTLPKEKRGK
jgi:signal transduction histidine kinase